MADLKISQFDDGGLVQETDEIAAVRSGVNTKVTVGSAAAYEVGTGSGQIATVDDLAPVALSNDYEDLGNLPTLGDLAAKDQVEASDIDSGSATAGQVPTSDGSGGVTWQDQSGSGTVAASAVSALDPNSTGSTNVQGQLDFLTGNNYYNTKSIGEPFPVFSHLTGVAIPSNAGTAKFIRLSASSAYNDGLLTNQIQVGSGPTLRYSAEIDIGPLSGQRIELINSNEEFLKPAATSGSYEQDAIRNITGTLTGAALRLDGSATGAFSGSSTGSNALGGTGQSITALNFSASNATDVLVADRNRPKSFSAIYYMRIL